MSGFIPKRKITFRELQLIPEAIYQLFKARLKVSFLPSSKYIRQNTFILESQKKHGDPSEVILVSDVINGLAFRTPWKSTCLVKVLAASKMLRKRRISHKIHFGIAKKNIKEIKAHAWLSANNNIYIGGGNLDEFKEISSFTL